MSRLIYLLVCIAQSLTHCRCSLAPSVNARTLLFLSTLGIAMTRGRNRAQKETEPGLFPVIKSHWTTGDQSHWPKELKSFSIDFFLDCNIFMSSWLSFIRATHWHSGHNCCEGERICSASSKDFIAKNSISGWPPYLAAIISWSPFWCSVSWTSQGQTRQDLVPELSGCCLNLVSFDQIDLLRLCF